MKYFIEAFANKVMKFWISFIFLLIFVMQSNAAKLDLNDMPLIVSTSVPPNLIVSMDDSGSMAWGFMPDSIRFDWEEIYFRSSHYNKIFYNPTVTYKPPMDSLGNQLANADYTNAIHGYYYDSDHQNVVNLSTSFLAVEDHYHYQDADFLGPEEDESSCGHDEGEPCDAQPAYYYEFDSALTNCTDTIANQSRDNDCYNKVVINTESYTGDGGTNNYERTLAEEQANFANWFQYYSIRGDAGKTALTRAFVPDSVSSAVRVGRQALNNGTTIHSGASSAQVAEFDAAERADFYDWIYSVRTSNATPLRSAAVRAGNYYTNLDAYRDIPSNSSSDAVSCRLNTHIMLTDGFYNGSFTDPADFFQDEDTGNALPDGTAYNPGTSNQFIYPNANSDESLADIMWHYWASDLAPTLTDNLEPYYTEEIVSSPTEAQYWNPANDPATWQHMVSYMVSFGLSGSVPTTEAVYQNLLNNEPYTPNSGTGTQTGWPGIGNDSGIADDLYHAGINGHGGFFSATDPNELVDAFKSITERIAARESTASTVAVNSGRISSGDLVYLASFDTEKWIGRLQAFEVSDGSGYDPDVENPATCNDYAFGTLCSEVWDAAHENTSETLPHGPRKIFTYDSTEVSPEVFVGGIEFKWSSLNAAQAALLDDGDGLGEARVNYLRGDDSNETENGGTFRSRRSLIPDGDDTRVGPIVHSSPVYVGNGVDANGFRQYAFPEESYSTFLTTIASRDPIIYAGGNDGMLHAYNAERTGGEEVFAYVPNAVLKDVHELTESTFSSGAYVDGSISTLDVFYDNGWHSVLVGGLRTGGKGYYALDITFPTAAAADVVLWEFTDDNDADMGYTFGKAQIVKLNNGKWAAIVANGYNSTNEKAVLFVLDMETGDVIKKFIVDENENGDNDNGLSGPVAISVNRDFEIDYIYAGDLKGNMWKFDLKSSNVNEWTFSKLFTTEYGRPITGSVTIGNHPNNGEGRVVYFGTGKYLEQSDLTATLSNRESFYAILDDDSCTGTDACIAVLDLVSQTIDSASTNGRTITDNPVDWYSDKGWRVGLSAISDVSERMVGRPVLSGSLIIFNTIVPESGRCNSGGETFTFLLDRRNGGAFKRPIIDFNGDGFINGDDNKGDKPVVTIGSSSSSGPSDSSDPLRPLSDNLLPDIVILSSNVGNEKCIINPITKTCESFQPPEKTGRVRWRQLK